MELTKPDIDSLKNHFLIKPENVRELKRYLSPDIKKIVESSIKTLYWNMGSNSYVEGEICIVDKFLSRSRLKVSGKGSQYFSALSYRPELDETPFYSQELHTML